MRELTPRVLGRKVTALVPEGCAEGLRQFARDLRQRQEAGTSHVDREWRKLSPSAELFLIVPLRHLALGHGME
jgi:hypothetical protein